jgi:hypothetical protein
MPVPHPTGATRHIDRLRVPIPAPLTDEERLELLAVEGELTNALERHGYDQPPHPPPKPPTRPPCKHWRLSRPT